MLRRLKQTPFKLLLTVHKTLPDQSPLILTRQKEIQYSHSFSKSPITGGAFKNIFIAYDRRTTPGALQKPVDVHLGTSLVANRRGYLCLHYNVEKPEESERLSQKLKKTSSIVMLDYSVRS